MPSTPEPSPEQKAHEVENLARGKQSGMLGEFVYFLKTNKKWWLAPILVVVVLLGAVVVLGSSGAAPFIYTLF